MALLMTSPVHMYLAALASLCRVLPAPSLL